MVTCTDDMCLPLPYACDMLGTLPLHCSHALVIKPHAYCRGQSQGYNDALTDINIFFVATYVTEAVLKNLAVGPWAYIKDNW